MLEKIIDEIYKNLLRENKVKDLENDKELIRLENKIKNHIKKKGNTELTTVEDYLIYIECRMQKIAFKKGFQMGLKSMIE